MKCELSEYPRLIPTSRTLFSSRSRAAASIIFFLRTNSNGVILRFSLNNLSSVLSEQISQGENQEDENKDEEPDSSEEESSQDKEVKKENK